MLSTGRFLIGVGLLGACVSTGSGNEPRHPLAGRRIHSGATWDDPIRCREAVEAGARLGRAANRVRVGTWNLHWFPDGIPSERERAEWGTDIEWLACAIAWLDVDLLGLQEVKLTARGHAAFATLRTTLRRLTGARWDWTADSCPDPTRPHLALLYRPDRVTVTMVADHPEIDSTAKPNARNPDCPGDLRPALAAYVKSNNGGLDFHFVTTHLNNGRSKFDLESRRFAWAAFNEVRKRRQAVQPDADLVIAADFNSIGCAKCDLKNGWDEIRAMRSALRDSPEPLDAMTASERCSAYYRGWPKLVDHIAATSSMEEARGVSARVAGICAAAACKKIGPDASLALQRLSDHCPVIADFVDQDRDPVHGPARVDDLGS